MLSTGHSCRVSDFLWLVTESTLLPPEQIFTQIEKNISKSFRRNLRELSNNAMSLQLSPRNIFWLVTESTLLPLEHIITQNWRKRFFFLNIFVKIQQMLHEDVQEISLQLSPRNMTTENSPLEIQFRNNIQIIFDSTLNSISLTCWRAVIMVVAMPVIYNDCGEASNDCKIVVTDLKTDNYLWQALTLKCWWLIIALKPHLFLCFTLSFYIFKGTWSNETLTKKNTKC